MADSERDAILRDWYRDHYACVAASANGSFGQRFMHEQMERGLAGSTSFPRVLEVGANRGEHLPFVRHGFSCYVVSDLVRPELARGLSADPRIVSCQCDAAALPFQSGTFDRVIATCLLHHVDSPLAVARECRRVVRPGGRITILLPTDPGAGYRFGVWLTSARAARREGLADRMELVKALDHRNHFRSIARQLRYVLSGDHVEVRYLPARVPSVAANLFTVWQVVKSQ